MPSGSSACSTSTHHPNHLPQPALPLSDSQRMRPEIARITTVASHGCHSQRQFTLQQLSAHPPAVWPTFAPFARKPSAD
ncbi:hypothetical protein IG631_09335 [Alternaria alternata]|nr:hypothetical protein IG631_09335 [Alternaria alternata]